MCSRNDPRASQGSNRIVQRTNLLIQRAENPSPSFHLEKRNKFLLKPNSWTYNFVEFSGHNLESSKTWGFHCLNYKPVCSKGGGRIVKSVCINVTVASTGRRKSCPNYVSEFGLCTFTFWKIYILYTLRTGLKVWKQHSHLRGLCRWFRFAQLAKGKKFRP